jgi:hypothetical protein
LERAELLRRVCSPRALRMVRIVCACAGLVVGSTGLAAILTGPGAPGEKSLVASIGIVADTRERLYVGLLDASVVQVYSSAGKFERTIAIDALAGDFRFRVSRDDQLEVATTRNRMLYRYTLEGVLSSATPSADSYDAFGLQSRSAVAPTTGVRYELGDRSIVATYTDGSRQLLVQHGWWPWAFVVGSASGPFFVSWGVALMFYAVAVVPRLCSTVGRTNRPMPLD